MPARWPVSYCKLYIVAQRLQQLQLQLQLQLLLLRD